jgi:hypothetical protein
MLLGIIQSMLKVHVSCFLGRVHEVEGLVARKECQK